ncbi:hypothetical protein DPMN_062321 [Dreissena polymorpha]|uniref:Uncharacterized protein n=1 Tax=Dreissena polymorpha TaxID=45954 RepID=A0A9D4C9C6_DREPO|nr:hypothetical protein DPMN_062321 [Dreissena polymorpha]
MQLATLTLPTNLSAVTSSTTQTKGCAQQQPIWGLQPHFSNSWHDSDACVLSRGILPNQLTLTLVHRWSCLSPAVSSLVCGPLIHSAAFERSYINAWNADRLLVIS